MLYQHCEYFKDISCLKNKAPNLWCYELKCCRAIQEYQHFGKTCLHLQDQSKGQQNIPIVWTGCKVHSHQVHVESTGSVRKPVLRTTLFLSHGNCEKIALLQGHCRREIGSACSRQRSLYSFKEQMEASMTCVGRTHPSYSWCQGGDQSPLLPIYNFSYISWSPFPLTWLCIK